MAAVEADVTSGRNTTRPRPTNPEAKCYTVNAGRENLSSLILYIFTRLKSSGRVVLKSGSDVMVGFMSQNGII